MEIKFLGAAQEVTGSNYLVKCGGRKIFVDCGMHHGRDEDEKNKEDFFEIFLEISRCLAFYDREMSIITNAITGL